MNTLKQIRLARGYSQSDLAKEIGVTQTAISQWECELTKPSTSLLPKLAKVLNCTIDELLKQA